MKYLKSFNESVDIIALNKILELKGFTEDCLAYLLDEGLDVGVEKAYKEEGIYEISLSNEVSFNWSQIKDYYIPFIQLLSNRYELISTHYSIDTFVVKIVANSGYYWSNGSRIPLRELNYYTYDDIINDRVHQKGVTKFNSIMVRVKEK